GARSDARDSGSAGFGSSRRSRFHAEESGVPDQQDAQERDRERGKQREFKSGRSGREGSGRGRGSDFQTNDDARPWQWQRVSEADESHPNRFDGRGGN